MAKISRKAQKIFAGNYESAPDLQLAEFGSLKNLTPLFSSDPDYIQTTAYLNGWAGAVINNVAPAMQDMNSLFFLITRQLAYLMQAGIAERDSTTVYYTGSMVNDGHGNIFKSQIDSNTSALSVKASWRLMSQGNAWTSAVTYHIGDLVRSTDGTTLYCSLIDSNTSALTVKTSWRIVNQGRVWNSSNVYHTGDVVISTDGKTAYACLSDTVTAALTDASKWQPIVQNSVTTVTGPTAAIDCQTAKVFNVAIGVGGNKTLTLSNMYDGQRIDIIVNGASTNTVSFTLTNAAAPSATALTLKSGTGYSGTMTSAVSMFTLTRYSTFVVAQSYHGMA